MKKLFACVLLLVSLNVSAFTQTEKNTLKAAILAELSIQSCVTNGQDSCVANWLNSNSTFVVWKTSLALSDIIQSDAFAFNLVDGLTAGKRDEWSDFIFRDGVCNPAKANIRAGFLDVWSGTAAKTAVYNAIIDLSKRFATQAEKLFATGAGTNANPATLTFEGQVTESDVVSILRG